MLIFKKNIYYVNYSFEAGSEFGISRGDNEGPKPIAYNFILSGLANDRKLFLELSDNDPALAEERLKIFFPNATRFGGFDILNRISKRLMRGLLNNRVWYGMNCYHLCYLYDTLMGIVEDYSYGDKEYRENLFPEMEGQAINFNQFLNEYFFHTAFLIDPGRYRKLSPKERLRLGKVDHSLMGAVPVPDPSPEEVDLTLERVINRVPPTPEDLELDLYPGNPYLK